MPLAAGDRLGRQVAIKILPSQLAADTSAGERLHRKAVAAAASDHVKSIALARRNSKQNLRDERRRDHRRKLAALTIFYSLRWLGLTFS